MTELVYQCLRDAVNLARSEQLRTVNALRSRLSQHGYDAETIQSALKEWANYEKSK